MTPTKRPRPSTTASADSPWRTARHAAPDHRAGAGLRRRAAPARRAVKRGGSRPRQQQIKIVVEMAGPQTQVGRPDVTEDALRSAQIEGKKGRAKL